ncbi:hypothetical protein AB0F91_07945 [Amycolatopsis sp. NPDC023774]|uniref:hypothetical protein n=1 Tax=Amycolatopsis sp. NPDC023774 TaxID=3155015 RepID=UPI0033D2C256
MAAVVEQLGDDLGNTRLELPSANTPYAVLNRCLGATAYWAGEVVSGRAAHRDRDCDRDAEFTAAGPVAPLLDRVRKTVRQLTKDVPRTRPCPPRRAASATRSTPATRCCSAPTSSSTTARSKSCATSCSRKPLSPPDPRSSVVKGQLS